MKTPVRIALLALAGLAVIASAIHLLQVGSETMSSPGTSLQVGKTETHSNMSSSSSSCSSENSTFSARRVLFYADNPHPLSRKIAAQLAQKLKDCPQIEVLELADRPFAITNSAATPDLFLSVNLAELQQGGFVSSTMKSLVTATFGNQPWQSSHHGRDDSTPPVVAFDWKATMESETTFTGVRTDRYAEAAGKMADDLAKAIRKQIEEQAGKFPALPELPADFFGPYQPVADFDGLKELQARRAASYCGLFTHNETFWRFQTATNPVPQLERIVRQLEAAGWRVSENQMTNTWDHRIAGQNGGARLEIFRLRNERMSFSSGEKPPAHFDFVAHYRQPFTRAEREAAVKKLFAASPSAETLLPFLNNFSQEQRQQFYALVEKSPTASPNACVQLAEHFLSRKRTNDAVHLLLRAKALAATLKDPSTIQSAIESASKKISPKKDLKLEITPDLCRELGFLELTNVTQTIGQNRSLGQPLVFFGPGQRGVKIFSLTVSAPHKDAYPWLFIQAEDGSRSSSWSSFTPDSKGEWLHTFSLDDQHFKITAVPLPDQHKITFTVQAGG